MSTVERGQVVEDIPSYSRKGEWVVEFEEFFVKNPGKTKMYPEASPTTGSNLKKNHGLTAVSRNQRKIKDEATGKERTVVDLYVKYEGPERAEQIKAEAAARVGTRAKRANQGGNNSTNAAPQTPEPAKAGRNR